MPAMRFFTIWKQRSMDKSESTAVAMAIVQAATVTQPEPRYPVVVVDDPKDRDVAQSALARHR
jgi:hypothetical protein